MTTDDQIAYGDAIAELEAIVARLEDTDVDVDVLADRVTRAAELITLCRDRIARTRIEVERVVADLEPE
ncbi:MAG: xseB [Acidimicrobiales bacterium]|jgi:exodeoxyribonuclease VII small subunit|nr:xseB [Acidimicrobiales bacterium]